MCSSGLMMMNLWQEALDIDQKQTEVKKEQTKRKTRQVNERNDTGYRTIAFIQ